jgi:hypothetical protein
MNKLTEMNEITLQEAESKVKGLIPVEFQEQRVLLTNQVAEIFDVPESNIGKNFRNNKSRAKEGREFFKLEGEALKAFKNEGKSFPFVSNKINCLYLWTERGVMFHAKMLNTDTAWDIFNMLVDNYFEQKQQKQLTPLEMLAAQANALVVQERRQKALEIEQAKQKQELDDAISKLDLVTTRLNNLDGININGTPRQILNNMMQAYALQQGIRFATSWNELYKRFKFVFSIDLKARYANYVAKNQLNKKKYKVIDYIEDHNFIGDAIRVADKMLNK